MKSEPGHSKLPHFNAGGPFRAALVKSFRMKKSRTESIDHPKSGPPCPSTRYSSH
jgi:hypothetical protein